MLRIGPSFTSASISAFGRQECSCRQSESSRRGVYKPVRIDAAPFESEGGNRRYSPPNWGGENGQFVKEYAIAAIQG